ncbi:MAG: sigma-70 family RNA polymerase sigma factor [Acidobacteriota bacterium]|nr:MAG: sigma-70 family RNA polymerase sigma factor [Acidobacteriota bacterium]
MANVGGNLKAEQDREVSDGITRFLKDWSGGDDAAKERLMGIVYEDLRNRARHLMSKERADHTLQPTALVHEAIMRLGEAEGLKWDDRGHFFGIFTRIMRQVLVDHARAHVAIKRGNSNQHVSTDEIEIAEDESIKTVVEVDGALEKLEAIDERQAMIVEMRFFGGLSIPEIAETLGISERTVAREWGSARLWLKRELG